MDDLSPTYLEHFQAPKNIGDADPADLRSEVEHQGGGCHDRLRVTLTMNEDGTVANAMFRARACSGTIAASSAATEWAKGKTKAQLAEISPEILIEELDGIPERKRHSVELAAQALREAAQE